MREERENEREEYYLWSDWSDERKGKGRDYKVKSDENEEVKESG